MADTHPDIQAKLALLRVSYAEQLPHKYAQIAEAWKALQSKPEERATLAVMHRIAHSLTGSGATFGFDDISTAARLLERQLKELLEAEPTLVAQAQGPIENAMLVLQRAIRNAHSVVLPSTTGNSLLQVHARPLPSNGERTVFIVEDDAHFAQEVALQLGHYGYRVRVFSKIAGVEEALRQSVPAAVIVDLVLPDGNSAEEFAAAGIAQKWQVPLIFVSSKADFRSRLQAVRAGSLAYFAKPLDIGALIDRLDVLTNVHPAEEYRILVVDDSESVAKYHASILEQVGMQVRICTDPAGIMQPLVELNQDLILMEVYMH